MSEKNINETKYESISKYKINSKKLNRVIGKNLKYNQKETKRRQKMDKKQPKDNLEEECGDRMLHVPPIKPVKEAEFVPKVTYRVDFILKTGERIRDTEEFPTKERAESFGNAEMTQMEMEQVETFEVIRTVEIDEVVSVEEEAVEDEHTI